MRLVPSISVSVPVFVFFVMCLLVVFGKSSTGLIDCPRGEAGAETGIERLSDILDRRGASRPNLRIAPEMVRTGLELVARGLAELGFHDLYTSPFYLGTPWPLNNVARTVLPVCHSWNVSVVLFISLSLAPILALAFRWFTGAVGRVLFIMAAMYAVLGWHPTVISGVISVMKVFADWPHSYYQFAQPLHLYDFMAAGLVLLFFLLVANSRQVPVVAVIAATIVGHLTFEYMMLILAMPLLLMAAVGHRVGMEAADRRRNLRLGVIAVGAGIATAAAVAALDDVPGSTSHIGVNLDWTRSNTADLATIMIPALMAGAVASILSRPAMGPSNGQATDRAETMILAAMVAAYLLVFVIGLFTASYPSEMGRQFMPLGVLCVLLGSRVSATLFARRVHRAGDGAG